MRPVIIWDLDGTMFDNSKRLPYILGENPDWPKYHELTYTDKPIEPALMMYRALLNTPYIDRSSGSFMRYYTQSFILTGRSDRYRQVTEEQLRAHGIDYHALYLRPHADQCPSAELKAKYVAEIRAAGFDPILAFEDEPNTIKMYRDKGIHVFGADDKNWRNGKYREVKHD